MKALKTSLASEYPDIAKEWHPTCNGDLTPDTVAPRSNKKVHWLCPNGHTYITTPDHRTGRSAGCPYCSGKKVLAGYNDLSTIVPSLAAEWDYNRNLPLTPQAVTSNSHKKVWWKCPTCGHEWQATVNDRYRKRGCPACAVSIRTATRLKTMLKPGVNDLASQRPDLVSEWSIRNDDAKPEDFTINSKYMAWWKCSVCGNEWQASIHNRTINNSGCPKCMRYTGTSFPEQSLYYYFKKMFPDAVNGYKDCFGSSKMELDLYIPDINTGIEYDGQAWHSSRHSKTREKKKYNLCQANNIRLIRISEIQDNEERFCDELVIRKDLSSKSLDDAITEVFMYCGVMTICVDTERDRPNIMLQYITMIKDKSIAQNYPDAVAEWDIEKNGGLTADMVVATSNEKYWWKCEKGHSYQSTPANKLPYNYGCPYCSNHRVLPGFNDLETRYPDLAKEWDYEKNKPRKPSEILYSTTAEYWWICPKGHSYSVSPGRRIKQSSGCPFCVNRLVLKGYNDLATTNPEIAAMWDYEKNKDITPDSVTSGSDKEAWWRCDYKHSFKKTVRLQVISPSCPVCEYRTLLTGFNDLATTHPALAAEWDYEKNGGLGPDSVMKTTGKKVWWKCSTCGHEWQAHINLRVLTGNGCPKCGYSKKMQATRAANIKAKKQDLVSRFPEIAAEWDYERNVGLDPTELTPSSNRKVWWICPKGHHYKAWMSDRTGWRKTGCPYCAGKRKLNTEF